MTILVTGAAGFIGFHTCKALLAQGKTVVGVDNLNDYYDVTLKQARLQELDRQDAFSFLPIDIADKDAVLGLQKQFPDIDYIIHLAAQPGVRYSLVNPYAYITSNIDGSLCLLELCRTLKKLKHFVYASSSSVYGDNAKKPYAVEDRVDQPISLYAATKKATELMVHTYVHLYGIPATGLRFFTVYGPWGRPDMAPFIFTKSILEGKPIQVFNEGKNKRDFTYIDDTVQGILGCYTRIPSGKVPNAIYNLGNNKTENTMDLIKVIEEATQCKADIQLLPIQPGDVVETYADIDKSKEDFGYNPSVSIAEGIPQFVDWYRSFYHV